MTTLDESGRPMAGDTVTTVEWGCVEALRAAVHNLNNDAVTPAECSHGVGTVTTKLGQYDVSVVLRRVPDTPAVAPQPKEPPTQPHGWYGYFGDAGGPL